MYKEITPIIFIWIGNKFPKWGLLSLEICCKNNKERKVILLHDKNLGKKIYLKKKKLDNLYFQLISIKDDSIFNQSNTRFKDSFWLNTSLRLKVLYYHASKNNISSFFHAELDNMIFNLDNLDEKFNNYGSGIFVPRDSIDRAIGSILFCNRINSLFEILSLYKEPFNARNDMSAFGLYAQKSKNFFSLPTESFKENLRFFNTIHPHYTQGIFDAASIGQYCFGIDPKISKYYPTKNLFINENSKIDFKNFEIFVNDNQVWIKTNKYSKKFKVYNMHIHCKDFKLAINLLKKKSIFKSIQNKKQVIITGRYKLIFGKVLLFFDNLKFLIKKIIY